MPALLNRLLRLLPTNPICMRLVQGGSKRRRHLLIRSGYLAVMIFVLLFAMVAVGNQLTVRELAANGAQVFTLISYLQIGLICLLTPIFMAGAIAQEANPQTWDILLTTPLGNLQIVLGNMFGRLFFILALLFSTLPLFAVTQYFGGVPGVSIFASYAVAGTSSLLVAAIAITLSVNRTAGKRAVFWFYAAVVMYLFVTYAIDAAFLRLNNPVGIGTAAYATTWLTPLNPFLALEALLNSNRYVIHDLTGTGAPWIEEAWLSHPISTFCWICVAGSALLVGFSTLRVRTIGARTGSATWYRRMLGLGAKGAVERPARPVGNNPVAWRESVARGRTLSAIVARWGFVALGILIGIGLIALHWTGTWTVGQFQDGVLTVLAAEIVVIALVALNMSATAVSREREDGTLDLILTTPIQPGPYLLGKLRGLIQFLVPLLLVPTVTLVLLCAYVLADGFGRGAEIRVTPAGTAGPPIAVPIVLPEAAVTLPLVLLPFIAVCVMIGLHWSVKSKGTIGSVIAAVAVTLVLSGVVGFCGAVSGSNMPVVGAVFTATGPLNLLWASVLPAQTIPKSIADDPAKGRIALAIGAVIAATLYGLIVYALHTQIKRNFMMTVRRLAGAS